MIAVRITRRPRNAFKQEFALLLGRANSSVLRDAVANDSEDYGANRAKNGDPDSFAFREQRKTENQNLITDFVARSDAPFVIQARRMRSTWLVHHIDNGTPLVPFMKAAGIQSLEALDRFLPMARPLDSYHWVRDLRS